MVAIIFGANYVWKNFRGAGSAFRSPGRDITEQVPPSTDPNLPEAVNQTGFPLTLPKGFVISIFAKNLPGARGMALDKQGNLWVSQTSQGKISFTARDFEGKIVIQEQLTKLNKPHGLATDPQDRDVLYFAEEDKISRLPLFGASLDIKKIADLPKGGRHFTRTLLFGSDGRLYVSIGSSCDVCNEKDGRYAAIYSMNKDGSDFKKVASGLRNSVFMALNPSTGKIWATEMGRDHLGDDLPPDEINIIDPNGGSHYGWPFCYGKNIHDTNFDKNQYFRDPCADSQKSFIDLPAHSAPLGLAFIPKEGWPEDYQNNLIVAFHGSWNRSEPTGYKLARIKLDKQGSFTGMGDFISGWLAADGKTALGRPVDILVQPGGIMYVSDDKAGVIYKVQYLPSQTAEALVIVDNIKENEVISSPLKIIGQAKGNWFFEASFPIRLLDGEGKEIAVAVAQAQSDWMTENFVPFSAQLQFSTPSTPTGTLVLQKDNPSGLPENDGEVRLPVRFKN